MRRVPHIITLLVVCFLCSVNIEALAKVRSHEEKIDSLEKILESETENNLRPDYILKILNELCWELRGTDTEKALRYGKNGLTMAREYLKNSTEQSEVLMYKKAIAISLNYIGVVYDFKNDYEKALQYYLQALEKNEELGEKQQIAASLNNIGIIYYYLEDYMQTLKYYKRALSIREELDDKEGVAGSLNNIALVYINQVRKTGDISTLDDAIKNLQKSLTIKEKLGDDQGVAGCYGNIGNVYKYRAEYSNKSGDFAAAIDYHFRALQIFKALGDQKGLAITLLDIADIHKMQKSYRQCIKYVDRSIKAAKQVNAKVELKTAYRLLSEVYELSGDYKNALKYHLDFTKLKDSLFSHESTQKIMKLESDYQHRQQEEQNAILAKENEVLASRAKTDSILKNSLIIMVLLLLVVTALVYTRYKEKKEQNLEIEKLSMVASKTDNYVIITDKYDRIEWVNEGFSRITGYTVSEVMDKRPDVLLRGALTDPKTETSIETKKRKCGPFTEEILNYTKSGNPIWLSMNVNPVLNDQGEIDKYITIGNDITKKKKADDEIKKLSLIASKTDNFVVLTDRDDVVEWVNEGFTRLLGYSEASIKGKRLRDVLTGKKTDQETLIRIQVQKQNKVSFREELVNYKKDGTELWLSYNITPIFDDHGEIDKFINIGSDVTESKKTEGQLKSVASKLKLINAVDKTILSADSFTEIIQFTINKLYRELDIARASMVLFDFENETFTPFSVAANTNSFLKEGVGLPLSDFHGVVHLRKFKNYVVQDIKTKEELSGSDKELIKEGVNSYLLCPLIAKNELLGSINICCDETNYVTAELIALVEEIAKGVAIALYQRSLQEEIEKRNADLKDKNDDITYSIKYARKIQEAIFPSDEQVHDLVDNCFVYFKPKEIVSGDFIWTHKQKDKFIIAVADCTGHGVPGAFMSIIGNNHLNAVVKEQRIYNPAKILNLMNLGLNETLKSGEDDAAGIRDGIDISLCMIDTKAKKMQFAGANNPVYIVRKKELIELKGDRYHSGTFLVDSQSDFTLNKFDLKKGDDIYLFSDGFADQFGGTELKKYKYHRFKKTILEMHGQSMLEQRDTLKKDLRAWRNPSGKNNDWTEQTDDICVVGIRV
ncbi:MAG TPA: PAS domain-containing protein [Flavobacteriales bacterium]|nr:PAS domain-containing protein [Flavobacteriales bacterium]